MSNDKMTLYSKRTEVLPQMKGEVVLYQPTEDVRIEARLVYETIWLTQQQIADLFGTKRPAITKHISNIYTSGELDKEGTCSILEHMGNEGKQRYTTLYYNLDMILAVGYRVNSFNATQFRKWATRVLKDYLLKGYSVNNRLERLEQRVSRTEEKIDFFVRTSLPPVEGVIYAGHYTEEQKRYSCNYCHNQGLCQSTGVEARVGRVAQGSRQGGIGEEDEPLRRSSDRYCDARPRDIRNGIIIRNQLYYW